MSVAIMPRMLKGSRIHDAYPPQPTNLQLSDINSAFPLQEYIAHLVQQDPHNVESIVSIPGARLSPREGEGGAGLGLGHVEEKDAGVDEACWIYEQLRRLAQDLTHPLITALQAECTRETCPEMKAGEWLYLCVAHGTGTSGTMEQCCAIDYITHTLDSATALLNSPRPFPSRLQIPAASTRHFGSLARRLSRIFAHAYYHHREAFEQCEAESSLYARFLLMANRFELVPAEFLVLPNTNNDSSEAAQQQQQQQQQQHASVPPQPQTISVESAPSSAFLNSVPSQYASRMSELEQQQQHHDLNTSQPTRDEAEDEHDTEHDTAEFGANMSGEDRAHYGNMTVRSQSGGNGHGAQMIDSDRRTILNRSRTDTMYMRDFDLSEFASAAGDAMASVKAETEPHQEHHEHNVEEDPASIPHEEDDLSLGEDGYEEVEKVPEEVEEVDAEVPQDAKHEEDEEDEDHHLVHEQSHLDAAAAVPLPAPIGNNDIGTGIPEPEPMPTVSSKDDGPAQPTEPKHETPTAIHDADVALETLAGPAEIAAPVDQPTHVADEGVQQEESHVEHEEGHHRLPLEPGEVRVVSAHLGLESEGPESKTPDTGDEVSWADPVPMHVDEVEHKGEAQELEEVESQ
ncbi:hypothetical protein FRB96_002337 [Tulasnella sp. 330]|nr:hypothetical protein FRB96_002337 [Tulasnella sp. 330]